mmetsp:Transcript_84669/g.205360  ORF Transcript_84669/g.205360 Transcript_84669/m.205360 type:complete len:212 (-) Transcript_84669:18-653(-)
MLHLIALLEHVAIDAQRMEQAHRSEMQQCEMGVSLCHGVVHHHSQVHLAGNQVTVDGEHHHPAYLPACAHVHDRSADGLIWRDRASICQWPSDAISVLKADVIRRAVCSLYLVDPLPEISVALAGCGVGDVRDDDGGLRALAPEVLLESLLHDAVAGRGLQGPARLHLGRGLRGLEEHDLEEHREGRLRHGHGHADRPRRILIGNEYEHWL